MPQPPENKCQSQFLIVTNRTFRAPLFARRTSHRCVIRADAKPTGKSACASQPSANPFRRAGRPGLQCRQTHRPGKVAGCNKNEGANVKNGGHLTLAIAGRMRARANPSAHDSFCLSRRGSILDYRDQRLGLEPSRRLSNSRPRSGASPSAGDLGVGFKWPHPSIQRRRQTLYTRPR